jgi:hypothetical protein
MEIGEEGLLENAKPKRCIWLEEWQKDIDLCFPGLDWKLAGHASPFSVWELD